MEKVEGDPKKILSRARGCMTAAGLFFARGAEDISQTIELGLQADMKPVDIYKRCMGRKSADNSMLAATTLIIYYLVYSGCSMKKACLNAWQIADQFHDDISESISAAILAAERPDKRGKLVAGFITSSDRHAKLSLAIYLNLIDMEDTFKAHIEEIKKQDSYDTRIIAAAFAGARYGIKAVSA